MSLLLLKVKTCSRRSFESSNSSLLTSLFFVELITDIDSVDLHPTTIIALLSEESGSQLKQFHPYSLTLICAFKSHDLTVNIDFSSGVIIISEPGLSLYQAASLRPICLGQNFISEHSLHEYE